MKKIHIIHGWTYTTDAWDACVAALREKGCEPVQLNVPGLTEASSETWTLEKYVEWLKSKTEGERDLILVGHSNGGRIALAFAAKYPGAVHRLVLIDAAGIAHHEFLLTVKRVVFGTVAKVGRRITTSPFLRKAFYRLIGVRDYKRAPENMRETMKNLIKRDLTPELMRITTPTLIIWGEKDTATPLRDAHIMHERIRNSELYTIPDAQHSPHASHSTLVASKVADWI